MQRIKIIDAKRTAIGKFLGSFYECDPGDVCVQLARSLIHDAQVPADNIDMGIFGNALPAGLGQGINRKITINAGMPISKPSYLINMVCGSGMMAIENACKEIQLGKHMILCGGFEFMSNVPYATDTYLRLGKKFGDFRMIDLMTHDGLHDAFSGIHMGVTAENIAKEYGISRLEQEQYAVLSQQRTREAITQGHFKNEIVPIKLTTAKGIPFVFDADEFPNPNTTLENLAKLKPAFIKDGTGTITAGTSSGINDGASFLLLASEDYRIAKDSETNIVISGYAAVGCDPQQMGLGAFYAIRELLAQAKLSLNDIDFIEINEAFAAQALGCIHLLAEEYQASTEQVLSKTNIDGSGLGLGHPLGCSGARIVTTLFHRMKREKCKYGVASLCVGGGQGLAVLLEKED